MSKRYMWHASFRKFNGDTLGVSCSDAASLVKDGIRLRATVITLYRGKEIKGRIPTLTEMRGIFK